jgi:hypothetical protein
MIEIDAELVERNKRMGITVRRAPINYVGDSQPIEPKRKKPARGQDLSHMTPEEIKQRRRERALLWYHNKVAADPTYKEKRREEAKRWPKKSSVE